MHGLGNDFVVLDRRTDRSPLPADLVRRIGDRRRGVGFDQLLTIEPPAPGGAPFRYGVWNADGSIAGQCGNGARCIVAWLHRDGSWPGGRVALDAPDARIEAERDDDGKVRVQMGVPDFSPAALPFLAHDERATYRLPVREGEVEIGAVSMGNPHAVLDVASVDAAPVATLGPELEHHPAFPERCNIGFAQVLGPDSIRLRVHERGAGETLACGSGACAAVAVLARRGRVGPRVAVSLPGGTLQIDWAGPGHPIWMQGPAEFVYEGHWQEPDS